ncbi:MAG: pyridoxamine 5'-phosphate oxidase family protein [Desulfovibrionaceae bacterium]|nr:pyridoxamine 5'-phosphate oxidase family protein [Desulfovibrionaceae bacterium]
MRRAARRLSPADSLDILRRGAWGVLSLVSADGSPYGVPLNYALWEPEPLPELPATAGQSLPAGFSLIFHCAMQGLKLDILSASPMACFTVAPDVEINPAGLSTRYESVLAFGPVRFVTGERHDAALRRLGLRFSAAHPEAVAGKLRTKAARTAVLLLDIQGLSGKFNDGRFHPANNPEPAD